MWRVWRAARIKNAEGILPRFLNMEGNPQDWLHTSTARPDMSPGPEPLKLYYTILFEADQEKFWITIKASGAK